MKTLIFAVLMVSFGVSAETYQQLGDTVYGSDGTTYQQLGDTTFGSDGSMMQQQGNTTYITRGNRLRSRDSSDDYYQQQYQRPQTTCQRLGNTTFCN